MSSGELGGLGGVGGIEAAARRGACEAVGDLAVPVTTDIVSGVVAVLGKSRLNISKEIGEFSRTSGNLFEGGPCLPQGGAEGCPC